MQLKKFQSDCHVLVHYLNVKTNNKIDDQAEEIARSMIENKVFISLSQLHDQLSPICKFQFFRQKIQ